MTTTDFLALAKAHPETVAAVLAVAAQAVKTDPTLIPDVVTAVETRSYTGLAFKHLGVLAQLTGILGGYTQLLAALASLAEGTRS